MTLTLPSTIMAEPGALRVFSFGGGWQSTAALVLAARGDLDFTTFAFANVGDDSEHPDTLTYIRDHAIPFAATHGLALHVLHRVTRDGTAETLYGRLTREGSRSVPIPVRMSNGAPGNRNCTADFKIKVIGNWVKARGATRDNPATVGVGISVDEIHRANARRAEPHEHIVYPLLDLRLRRSDCPAIIRSAGLPIPPKSSCWFCPFHRIEAWAEMRRTRPDLFERACQLEDLLNRRRETLGKDHVYLTRYGTPLHKVVPDAQVLPFTDDESGCDSGWCFT